MKKILPILLFSAVILSTSCSAQTEKSSASGIQWMSFEQAVALNDKAPRKIFIDVYTGWCGWCKKMDMSTFKDSSVVNYINQHYYAVKLDAETRDTIRFRDKVFVYKPDFKANELAVSLLNGKMGYPSFVVMDEQYGILTPLSGYQTVPELVPVLTYFGTNTYKTTKWEDYQKN